MFIIKNKSIITPYCNKGFTLLVNPLRSVSRLLLGAHPTSILPVQGGRTIPKEHRCGFTLAETLITLVIVGVVAALTVPTLITKYQKDQTVTRLKKAYSALSQATQRAMADNGPVNTWDFGSVNYSASETINILNKYITPYMSIQSPPKTSADGGWNNSRTKLNGDSIDYTAAYVRFYLNDGTSVTSTKTKNDAGRVMMWFYVDINGDKKPNKMGRDIFQYGFYPTDNDNSHKNRIYPIYAVYTNRSSLLKNETDMCNKNQNGVACAALIMKDGWQIKDDYPW